MQIDVQELLKKCDFEDTNAYPGKRVIKKFPQSGDHKSHCAVGDWSDPDRFRLKLEAGLTGRTPPLSELKQYPISFQAQTYIDIVFGKTENEDGRDDDEEETKGKSGGGGKQPKKRNLEKANISLSAFGKAMDGAVSTIGEIEKFVVMGKELAREAYATALDNLVHQLQQAKVLAMDILKGTADIIKKATPGGGLEARGDETIKYRYDTERNGPMFGAMTP
jgi:hypothetical protein